MILTHAGPTRLCMALKKIQRCISGMYSLTNMYVCMYVCVCGGGGLCVCGRGGVRMLSFKRVLHHCMVNSWDAGLKFTLNYWRVHEHS